MVWKKVNNSDPGDADHYGGDDVDKISDLFSGTDVDDVEIDADFSFNSGRLKRLNPAGTFTLTEIHPAISANKDKRAYQPYNYLVMAEGATTYAINGLTGAVDSSSATPTTVLQYAMDNLSAARTQQEVVKVIGSFSVTSLSFPSYTVLDLTAGKITQTAATNTNLFINDDTTGGNTQIDIFGGTIDGNKTNQTADGTNYDTRNTINFTKVSHSSVHDTTIQNSNSSAVFLGECTDVHVSRTKQLNARKCGVRCDATSSSTGGEFIFINNNYMYNAGENFLASCTTTDITFEANECDVSLTNGINCCAPRNHLNHNIIRTCERAGITLGGEATPFGAGDYSEVIGNIIWECKGGGIFSGVTQGGDYMSIINNKVKGHPTLQDTSSGRAYGLRIRGNYGIVEGNQVWDWGRSGILVSGAASTSSFDSRPLSTDRLHIKNNTFHTNGQFGATESAESLKTGISILGSTTETAYNSNIKITGNISYNNINYGLHFKNTTGIVIEDNDFQSNITGAILDGGNNV